MTGLPRIVGRTGPTMRVTTLLLPGGDCHMLDFWSSSLLRGWYTICVSGGIRDMGMGDKMNCRVKGEVIF